MLQVYLHNLNLQHYPTLKTLLMSPYKIENGRLSDRYRIGTDTGCIVSNRIGYCCIGRPILRASLQVQHELLTGRIKQQIRDIRAGHPPRR